MLINQLWIEFNLYVKKGKMLSFTSSLSLSSDAFAIFVTEKYGYKDKKNNLPINTEKKNN